MRLSEYPLMTVSRSRRVFFRSSSCPRSAFSMCSFASLSLPSCIEQRATLYSSTEFKKIRLLYFTDDFKRWEAERT